MVRRVGLRTGLLVAGAPAAVRAHFPLPEALGQRRVAAESSLSGKPASGNTTGSGAGKMQPSDLAPRSCSAEVRTQMLAKVISGQS